jgi:cytochrome P450
MNHARPTACPFPTDPIAAVTHPDPYPYYAALVAEKPLYHDDALGLWVAAGADAVGAVLATDLCHVRPPAEPVPRALLGSPAGEIFRHLVRMNDGPVHGRSRRVVGATIASIDGPSIAAECRRWARFLSGRIAARAGHPLPGDFAFQLPVHVVGSLLGVPTDALPAVAGWIGDFARCLAAPGDADLVARGNLAARHLQELFRSPPTPARHAAADDIDAPDAAADADAVAPDAAAGGHAGDPGAAAANRIGLLFQAYDATAGLIGNTLLALASDRGLRERLRTAPGLLGDVVQEILRHDPPVQNTRRFVARPGIVAGQAMNAGDTILVVLAAANRDPSANRDPERFDPARRDRRMFTFGAGPHACPGAALAATIARVGVEELLLSGIDLARLAETVTYRASANLRIPLFDGGG